APKAPTAPGRETPTHPPGAIVPPRAPGAARPPREPARDVPTLPPDVAALTPRTTPPTLPPGSGRLAGSDTPAVPTRRPAGSSTDRVAGPVSAPPGSIHRPVSATRPPAERPAQVRSAPRAASSEGTAMALWGVRKLVSWGMLALALMFLIVFAWPVLGSSAPAGLGLVLFYVSEPLLQPFAQIFGPIRVRRWDPVPLDVPA